MHCKLILSCEQSTFLGRYSFSILAAMICVLSLACPSYAGPKLSTETIWSQIHKKDQAITSCRFVWRRTHTVEPIPHENPDEVAALTADQGERTHLTQTAIHHNATAARATSLMDNSGFSQITTIKLERADRAVYADLLYNTIVPRGAKPKNNVVAHFLNLYDGINAVKMEGLGPAKPSSGIIRRSPDAVLQEVCPLPGDRQLFAASAISEDFKPSDTSVRIANNNTVVLSKPFSEVGGFRFTADLAVSTDSWRPVSLSIVNVVDKSLHCRATVLNNRTEAYGVSYPTHIVNQFFTANKHIIQTDDYTLTDAVLNNSKALNGLKTAIQAGMTFDDYRFGAGVKYRARHNRLPTDEEVKLVVMRQAEAERKQHSEKLLPPVLIVGLLLVVAAFTLWRRYRDSHTA